MKTYLAVFLLSGIFAQSAHARYIGPSLARDYRTGYTLPEFYKSERCEIYADKVVKKTTKADGIEVVTEEFVDYPFTPGDAFQLLNSLQKRPLKLTNGFVDGPKITYTGFLIQPTDAVKTILIAEDNGDTGEYRSRNLLSERLLRSFIDAACK